MDIDFPDRALAERVHDRAPEHKAGGVGADAAVVYDEMMRVFESYKADNDQRVAAIERRGAADVLTEEKVARLNDVLDPRQPQLEELTLKQARPALGHEQASPAATREHKMAFDAYVRTGETTALRQLELKALSVGSNPAGG